MSETKCFLFLFLKSFTIQLRLLFLRSSCFLFSLLLTELFGDHLAMRVAGHLDAVFHSNADGACSARNGVMALNRRERHKLRVARVLDAFLKNERGREGSKFSIKFVQKKKKKSKRSVTYQVLDFPQSILFYSVSLSSFLSLLFRLLFLTRFEPVESALRAARIANRFACAPPGAKTPSPV